MAFSEIEIKRIEKTMDSYIERTRPPAHIRDHLDMGYRVENQSVELFEIRQAFHDPKQKIEEAVAKTTYVKRAEEWRLYWMRADLKWHRYDPVPQVNSLEEFLNVVEEDAHCCFYG